MCGRYTLTVDPDQLRQTFAGLAVPEEFHSRFNIAPTQPVAVIPNDGKNQLDFYVWGLIPSWSKDPSIGSRMINARAETLLEKPSFRNAFRYRRCLIPADGFYEWKSDPEGKSKTPMYVRLRSRAPFAFAGLWENWNSPDGSRILSCTIITTEPNELMQSIHTRMPVILPQSAYGAWLQPGAADGEKLLALLKPYDAAEMEAYPVARLVNSPENDTPACIEPWSNSNR